jgi:hypothetical protein
MSVVFTNPINNPAGFENEPPIAGTGPAATPKSPKAVKGVSPFPKVEFAMSHLTSAPADGVKRKKLAMSATRVIRIRPHTHVQRGDANKLDPRKQGKNVHLVIRN